MSEIRVRFAPSPTGSLHVGGARTALYNWFFARGRGGRFVLRIEDTDVARSSLDSEGGVMEDLKWLGIDWNEGPDCGGEYGPYRQSERKVLYEDTAAGLLGSGKAYRCFCTAEDLEVKKKRLLAEGRPPHYDRHCFGLGADDIARLQREGVPSSIRFAAPEKEYVLRDIVRGEVRFPAKMIGDFILLRSDGMPTYNFSCVVDDHSMRISHVVRAEEHLSNTVRQLMLYEALAVSPPEFAHLSLILNRQRGKLSKRDGATSVAEYRRMGYLPEAVLNFLALLGWSPGNDREIMSRDELVSSFSLGRAAKSPAVFDTAKLDWMNGHYIRALDEERLLELSLPYFAETGLGGVDEAKFKQILHAVREGMTKLTDLRYHVSIFESEVPAYEPDAESLLRQSSSQDVIVVAARILDRAGVSSQEEIKSWLSTVGKETGKKGKELFMPVRAALTGQLHGPELPQVILILGKEACLKRLAQAGGEKR
ncbi:MAG: glutamate--tRNA ligase [Candidatus Eisenbacteria bacterium]